MVVLCVCMLILLLTIELGLSLFVVCIVNFGSMFSFLIYLNIDLK